MKPLFFSSTMVARPIQKAPKALKQLLPKISPRRKSHMPARNWAGPPKKSPIGKTMPMLSEATISVLTMLRISVVRPNPASHRGAGLAIALPTCCTGVTALAVPGDPDPPTASWADFLATRSLSN